MISKDQMLQNLKELKSETALIAAWDRFLREKRYVKNLSPKTISDYGCAWRAWSNWLPADPTDITERTIDDCVLAMRQAGLSAISTNSYLRVLKVFVRWLNIRTADGDPLPVPMMRAPTLVPKTFTRDELACLLHFRPTTMTERRVCLLMRMYIDTGARAEELLGLHRVDVDLDNCLIKISGKGACERIVPFSLPLRAELHHWLAETPDAHPTTYLFPTPRGHYSYRNCLRDFVAIARSKNITGRRVSLHTFRHSFASYYIANGGDPMRLQRLLGHSTLAMTQKYVSLQTSDLSQVHDRFSPLGSALQRLQGGRGRR
jgi:site-specific recombinase XerD